MGKDGCRGCGNCHCDELKAALFDLAVVLQEAWSRETAAPSCQDAWGPGNMCLGQCAVTALVVQDRFGGELLRVVPSSGGSHYYNRLPNGMTVDFTSGQFPPETGFSAPEVRSREYVLDSPGAAAARTRERYELLKAAIENVEDSFEE
ncbi:MAG: hypothetical protein WCT10_04675 [Patescibacteria group bacterium]